MHKKTWQGCKILWIRYRVGMMRISLHQTEKRETGMVLDIGSSTWKQQPCGWLDTDVQKKNDFAAAGYKKTNDEIVSMKMAQLGVFQILFGGEKFLSNLAGSNHWGPGWCAIQSASTIACTRGTRGKRDTNNNRQYNVYITETIS